MANDKHKIEDSKWGKLIPWILTISCFVILYIIGDFLIMNIEWYKQSVFAIEIDNIQAPTYRIHAYHIHMSMIKRSVGLFSGFAIMFLGLGVAFYSLRNKTDLKLSSNIWSLNLATMSPGIIALVIGGILIMYTIGSKDDFAPYPVIYKAVNDSVVNKEDSKSDTLIVVESPFKSDTLNIIKSPFK